MYNEALRNKEVEIGIKIDIFFKALTFNIFNFINLISFWLHWVFVAVRGLSLVVVHGFSLLSSCGTWV